MPMTPPAPPSPIAGQVETRPSLHRHCTVTAASLQHHCSVTTPTDYITKTKAPSLHRHCTTTVPSLYHPCAARGLLYSSTGHVRGGRDEHHPDSERAFGACGARGGWYRFSARDRERFFDDLFVATRTETFDTITPVFSRLIFILSPTTLNTLS